MNTENQSLDFHTASRHTMGDDTVEVPFNGSMMIAQRFDDGEIYTALKPICENIGIDFNGQKQKLERTPWGNHVHDTHSCRRWETPRHDSHQP